MTIQSIRLFGDPVLREPAAPVLTFDRELRKLVQDLAETMRDGGGVGLAAPQLGVGLRVFTYQDAGEVGHLVNPELEWFPGCEEEDDEEGCMSLPGLFFSVRRRVNVIARGVDRDGEPVELPASRQLARIFQHEVDHLDGVLFIDRLDEQANEAAEAAIRAADWYQGQPIRIKASPH